ncbi:MAG TPA: bifunctional [glutamine synthetase] adenylyltransferase/[glutamine synthetase]-adenylyl-L-tyrosine phosphorylase [Kiloniellales bacterium]|jgi:glutamate-ammonia-ligase adenylyltransferase
MSALFYSKSKDALPKPGDADTAARGLADWAERCARLDDPQMAKAAADLATDTDGRRLLLALFGNSPFLTDCALSDVAFFTGLVTREPGVVLSEVLARLKTELAKETDRAVLMSGLRIARRQVALLVAVADITGFWPVEAVVAALSDFADAALSAAVSHLLLQLAARGELTLKTPEDPAHGCGFVVLAMGKQGARELNYSSDVDLIVLFDGEAAPYTGSRGVQEAFVRLTRDLVRILEDRTADGYVFRTDLRLRPDPGAMPLAISLLSAFTYYEGLGQNWERAAMIKARPVAGDLAMGRRFLEELRPFIWRRNLDFWAIQDIHSIKRQIHAHKGGAEIAVLNHNIKLGRGGIREIELFAQTQQLIWGGREPRLRVPRTQEALAALAALGHVTADAARELDQAYRYLRWLEHRLQMIDDQQTQTLPADEAGLTRLAIFTGHDSSGPFRDELLAALRCVETHYAELFEEAPALSTTGNLVFTGGEPEPGTLETLAAMGFTDGNRVFNLVRAWHHGRHRATRSTRSRQLLTELMPTLLKTLGQTPQPDQALTKFDEFLSGLPAGVQLFSMLYANPGLLDMLAEIMGGAPALADRLSRNPGLLDAVLSPGFFDPIPTREDLATELRQMLAQARDFQDILDLSRRWTNDRRFQVGLHILRHACDIDESGRALSDIADTVLAELYPRVLDEFAKSHGHVPGASLAVIALGKLGAREMTVSSDLDLVFIYDAPEDAEPSDGAKSLTASHYFGRLAQRFINALTALTPEGRLYEIDMRLRPSGNAGPIATTLDGWRRYYEQDSWTWEHMALTRARIVLATPAFQQRIETVIRDLLCAPRDGDRLLVDVADMRTRIEREHSAASIWSVKFHRGGLNDLEFLAQYLLLRHAEAHPEILDGATEAAFAKLGKAKLLGSSLAQRLIEATRLFRQIQGLLRLTAAPAFDADSGTEGLKASLARAAGMPDFAALRDKMVNTARMSHEVFIEMIEEPAEAARQRRAASPEADSKSGP